MSKESKKMSSKGSLTCCAVGLVLEVEESRETEETTLRLEISER